MTLVLDAIPPEHSDLPSKDDEQTSCAHSFGTSNEESSKAGSEFRSGVTLAISPPCQDSSSVTSQKEQLRVKGSSKLKSPSRAPRPPIQQGELLPRTRILLKGEGIDLRGFFQRRRGVLFGGPGAFVPTCSDRHLAGFRDRSAEIKKSGVDFIGCIYANDPYVLKAWARTRRIQDQFTFISDVEGRLCSTLGLLSQTRTRGLGVRPRRFAMVIGMGGVVDWIGLDDASFVEDVLKFLGITPGPLLGEASNISVLTKATSIDAMSQAESEQPDEAESSVEDDTGHNMEEISPDDFSSQMLLPGRWRSLLLEASVRVDNLMRIPLKTLALGSGLVNDDTIQMNYNVRPRQHTISYTPRCLRISADTAQGFEGFGHLRYEGKTFLATEFHVVGPSPHLLGDKPSFRRPVELRIVHQILGQHKDSSKTQLLVVAVTFTPPPLTASERDNVLAISPFIHQLLEIPTLTASTYEVFQVGRRALQGGGFDLQSLFQPEAKFIKYSGVLSALGERVTWVVMKDALSLSRLQLHSLERYLLTSNFTVEDPSDAYVMSFVYRFLPKLKNIRAASGNVIIEALRKKILIMSKLDATLSFSAYEALEDASDRGQVAKWLCALKRKVIEKQRENHDLKGLIDRALEAFPLEEIERRAVLHGRQSGGEWYTTYLDSYLGHDDSKRLLDFVNKYADQEPDDTDDLGEDTPIFSHLGRRFSTGFESLGTVKRTSITSMEPSIKSSHGRSSTVASSKTSPAVFEHDMIRDSHTPSTAAPSSRGASATRAAALRRAVTSSPFATSYTRGDRQTSGSSSVSAASAASNLMRLSPTSPSALTKSGDARKRVEELHLSTASEPPMRRTSDPLTSAAISRAEGASRQGEVGARSSQETKTRFQGLASSVKSSTDLKRASSSSTIRTNESSAHRSAKTRSSSSTSSASSSTSSASSSTSSTSSSSASLSSSSTGASTSKESSSVRSSGQTSASSSSTLSDTSSVSSSSSSVEVHVPTPKPRSALKTPIAKPRRLILEEPPKKKAVMMDSAPRRYSDKQPLRPLKPSLKTAAARSSPTPMPKKSAKVQVQLQSLSPQTAAKKGCLKPSGQLQQKVQVRTPGVPQGTPKKKRVIYVYSSPSSEAEESSSSSGTQTEEIESSSGSSTSSATTSSSAASTSLSTASSSTSSVSAVLDLQEFSSSHSSSMESRASRDVRDMVSSHSASEESYASESDSSSSSGSDPTSSSFSSKSSTRGSSTSSMSELTFSASSSGSRRKSPLEDLASSKFLTEERVELVNFMLKQLKRSSSAESADDLTTANTAANCKSVKLTAEELAMAERKQAALKRQRHKADSAAGIRFALQDSFEEEEEWNADDRKVSRGYRLRNRKPTGHPALGQHVARMLMQMAHESSENVGKYDDGLGSDEGKFEPAALTAQPKKGALKKPLPAVLPSLSTISSGVLPSPPSLPPREHPVSKKKKRLLKKDRGAVSESLSFGDTVIDEVLARPTERRRKASPSTSSSSSQPRPSKNHQPPPQAESSSSKMAKWHTPQPSGAKGKTLSPKTSQAGVTRTPSTASLVKKRSGNLSSNNSDLAVASHPVPSIPILTSQISPQVMSPSLSSERRITICADSASAATATKKKGFGRLRGRMASMKTPDESIKIDNLRVSLGLI